MAYDYDFRSKVAETLSTFERSVLKAIFKTRRNEVLKALEGYDVEGLWETEQTAEKVKAKLLDVASANFEWYPILTDKLIVEVLEPLLGGGHVSAQFDEDSVDFSEHGKEIWIRFMLWGDSADPDNPDEMANYDRHVGPNVQWRLGVKDQDFDLTPDTKKAYFSGLSFVYKCRVTLHLPTQNILEKLFAKELDQVIEEGRKRAEREGLIGELPDDDVSPRVESYLITLRKAKTPAARKKAQEIFNRSLSAKEQRQALRLAEKEGLVPG